MKSLIRNLTWKHAILFTIVWLAYGCAYLLRKPFSLIKLGIKESMDVSDHSLGYIEVAFAVPYALGSVFLGFVGEKLGHKWTLGIGLIASALATVLMGLLDNYAYFLSLLFVSGLMQSLMAPASMTIIANWFANDILTSIMGIFCSSMVIGNIVSTYLTVTIVEISSWHNVFYIPSGIAAVIGIIVLLFVKNKNTCESNNSKQETTMSNLKFWHIIQIPKVSLSAFILFCMKGIRNIYFFWLPYYLTIVLKYDERQSGFISLIFELGSFFGPLILSIIFNIYISDLLASLISVIATVFFTLMLLFVTEGDDVSYFLYISLFFSGVFISTSDVVFGSSFVTKLGEKHGARSSIISVINGIGTIGNIVSGPLIAYSSYWFGMEALVPCVVIFCFFCTCSVTWLLFQQFREAKQLSAHSEAIQENEV